MVTKYLEALGIQIGSIYGYPGMILVFVSQLYSYVFLMTLSAFSSIDESLEEASRSLGARPARLESYRWGLSIRIAGWLLSLPDFPERE